MLTFLIYCAVHPVLTCRILRCIALHWYKNYFTGRIEILPGPRDEKSLVTLPHIHVSKIGADKGFIKEPLAYPFKVGIAQSIHLFFTQYSFAYSTMEACTC
jgi:hypothetical protein